MQRLAVVVVLLVSSCTGTIETGDLGSPGTGNGPDAGLGGGDGGGTGTGSGSGSGSGSGAAFACKDKVVTGIGSGQHRAGQDCQSNCHNHGFTLSGTLYANAAGTTPMVGASITVQDAMGKTFDMVSQQNGNFYTSQSVTFPVTVTASSCPDVKPMVAKVAATGAGCNMSGCHTPGAGAGAINLP